MEELKRRGRVEILKFERTIVEIERILQELRDLFGLKEMARD